MSDKINPEFGRKAFNCPFCGAFAKQHWYAVGSGTEINEDGRLVSGHIFNSIADSKYALCKCENCVNYAAWYLVFESGSDTGTPIMVYPKSMSRAFDLSHVPQQHASDYTEACLVLNYSPKASAALSRRCLQAMLREQGFNDKNLEREITNAIASNKFPTDLNDCLDAVRHFGNIAAHSTTDHLTGQILDVEPGEASWLLDTLEELFDHLYIKPERIKQKRAAANEKLSAAGKPPLK